MRLSLLLLTTSVVALAQAPDAGLGFSVANMDTSVSPCVDFYQYACGTWLAKNPIPPDRSVWSRFDALDERNHEILRGILEAASADNPKRSATEQKIGDYYASCMDEKAIDAKGVAPIETEMDRIAEIHGTTALVAEVARLHLIGANVLFDFGSSPDYQDSSREIATVDQSGLSLPDRDYYLKTDAKSEEIRRQYVAHLRRMFQLLGSSEPDAAKKADVVLRIETALAKGSLDRTARRVPANVHHKMRPKELAALTPAFAWPRYFRDVNAPKVVTVDVSVPDFFKQLQTLLAGTSIEDWRTYLTWHLVHAEAQLLPSPFVQAHFDFYGKILTGAKELRPRWKRCVSMVDGQLGDALGQIYVDRTFGVEGKQRTLTMVHTIETMMGQDLSSLTWMTPETKRQALEKLHAVANKIGFPDKWRDYSSVKVVRGDALGDSDRLNQFEAHRQIAKIGKPVDRSEWQMTPPTVNAYYEPSTNDINFPAGILQPPFYDNKMDDAVNFGAIGAVIGHELTHAFDDEGRHYDAKGNLRDWWTAKDAEQFEQRADCLVQQYSGYTAVDDIKLNGKLTLGENTADNGGLRLAYMALMTRLAERTKAGSPPAKIDDFTQEQRLFLGFGQIWCMNRTEESSRMRAVTDPHSPGRDRANGVVSNMPEFRTAFGCTEGQPMAPVKECRVW
jgi:putative endopeptidase